jgi:predicted SAM-dependent methyltransferase
MATALHEVPPLLKLALGCGKSVKDGFEGVDLIDYGQKHVLDLRQPWPWADESVGEVNSEHFVEHLDGMERVFFFNELYRAMAPKATALILTPNWSHACAYGDPTHKWPPMSAWYPLYLHKPWREINAPHVGYTCDFDWALAGSWDQRHEIRNQEFKAFAMQNYVDSLRDLIVTLTKRA